MARPIFTNNLKLKTMTTSEFLTTLSEYPPAYLIDEASNYAKDKAKEYLLSLGEGASLTIENGEVCIVSDSIDSEVKQNVQVEFDEAFSQKIAEFGFHE